MPTDMQILLIPRRGDRDVVLIHIESYEKMDRKAMVDEYNAAWNVGILGNHQQGLRLYALHVVFKRVFGDSPITFEDQVCLSLTDPILLVGENWEYKVSA
jgi:hypothetical protein